MKKPLIIDVSVVTGANEKLIFSCLRSLLEYGQSDDYSLNIIITCNNPGSKLPQKLKNQFPLVKIIENEEKKGFAKNHNQVIKESRADYLLIINDDIIFLKDSLQKMISFLERRENSQVGVLSPRLLNPDGSLQYSTYSFPTVPQALLALSGFREKIPFSNLTLKAAKFFGKDEGKSRFWAHDKICQVDTFRGACMLIRGKGAREVGLMDEVTLAGGEETEWHYRFWQKGWKIIFYPEAEIIHYGSQTVKTNSDFKNEYLKGYLNFFKKYKSRPIFYIFCLSALLIFFMRFLIGTITHNIEVKELSLKGIRIVLSWCKY